MPRKNILQDRGIIRVTFELPAQIQGRTVHLVGDFTSWKGVPMERRTDGGWHVTADLEPGRSYEFRYLIDGERWENDWDADRYVRNPFGHENSVIDTPDLPAQRGPEAETREERRAVQAGTARKAARTTTKGAAASAKAATKKTASAGAPAKKAKKASAKKASAKKTTGRKSAPRKGAGQRPEKENDRS